MASSLPPEVLDNVFESLLVTDAEWSCMEHQRRCLRVVCRSWNTSVDGNRRYWVRVMYGRFSTPAYIRFCIAQSGTRELTLSMDVRVRRFIPLTPTAVHNVSVRSVADYLADLQSLLSHAAPRVTTLDIVTDTQAEHDTLLGILGSWPLSVLSAVTCSVHNPGPSQQRPTGAFADATTMRSLRMARVAIGGAAGLYRHISRLYLGDVWSWLEVEWADIRAVLLSAGCLEWLVLDGVQCIGAAEGTPVTLPRLTALLVSAEDDDAANIARLLRLPSLSTLGLHLHGGVPLAAFGPVVRHLPAGLHSLDVLIAETEVDELLEALGEMASLQCLDLRRCAPAVFSCIGDALGRSRELLPQLHTLKGRAMLGAGDAQWLLQALAHRSPLDRVVVFSSLDIWDSVQWTLSSAGAAQESVFTEGQDVMWEI